MKREFYYCNGLGDAAFTVYTVFPGVELVYNSVHMDTCDVDVPVKGLIVEFQHCREGRLKFKVGKDYFNLEEGDLSVVIREKMEKKLYFPMNHYHGITIVIDTDEAPKCFSCFLKDVNVEPLRVAKRFCGQEKIFIFRKNRYIEHIFSELYTVPANYIQSYLKLKILELLVVLNGLDIEESKKKRVLVTESQMILAQDITQYLNENLKCNVSLGALTERFHVSKTYLQNLIRNIYGTSVINYMRFLRMQEAGRLLVNSELSIMEIASECGYSNASKFTAAFRSVMEKTPKEYRKKYKKL